MTSSSIDAFRLAPKQRELVLDLAERIRVRVASTSPLRSAQSACEGFFRNSELQSPLVHSASDLTTSTPRPPLPDTVAESSNAFGLFGTRGSGKSTLLRALRSALQFDSGAQTPRCFYVAEIIDCSLSPEGLPFAYSVLMKAHEDTIRPFVHTVDPDDRAALERFNKAFESVQRAFLCADPNYRRFARQLAISPEHYGELGARAIDAAFRLPLAVADWLKAYRELTGCSALVLLLDDVDITAASTFQGLVRSLLDELRCGQHGLYFVLAADEMRLAELLSWQGSADRLVDAALANEILRKIVPPDDRARVPPWSVCDRLNFLPFSAPSRGGRTRSNLPPTAINLRELLTRLNLERTLPAATFELLPTTPRGLLNLHGRLGGMAVSSRTDDSSLVAIRMMRCLADSRADGAAVEGLLRRRPGYWLRSFHWSDLPLSEAEWRWLRMDAQDPQRPLYTLEPVDFGQVSVAGVAVEPLWLECLSDLACDRGALDPIAIVEGIPQLRRELSSARIVRRVHEKDLRRDLIGKRNTVDVEFEWSSFIRSTNTRDEIDIGIGPLHLQERLLGTREHAPRELLAQMGVTPAEVETNVPRPRREELRRSMGVSSKGLLPRSLRGLVLLVGDLSDAPWSALSVGTSERALKTLVRAAALLTLGAYRRAVRDSLEVVGMPSAGAEERSSPEDAGKRRAKKPASSTMLRSENRFLVAMDLRPDTVVPSLSAACSTDRGGAGAAMVLVAADALDRSDGDQIASLTDGEMELAYLGLRRVAEREVLRLAFLAEQTSPYLFHTRALYAAYKAFVGSTYFKDLA